LLDGKIIVTSQWLEDCLATQGIVPLQYFDENALKRPPVGVVTSHHLHLQQRITNPIYYPLASRDGIAAMKQFVRFVFSFQIMSVEFGCGRIHHWQWTTTTNMQYIYIILLLLLLFHKLEL